MHLTQIVLAVVSFGLLYHAFRTLQSVRVTFERLQQLSGTDVVNFTRLRILGTNNGGHQVQTLNGTWQLHQDLDNNWVYFVRVLYQPPAEQYSGRFYQLTTTFRQVRVCDYLNGGQYKAWWNLYWYAINYPDPNTGRWICPFPRGEYFLRQVPLHQGFLPLVKLGLYRVEFGLANGGVMKMNGTLDFRVQPIGAVNAGNNYIGKK